MLLLLKQDSSVKKTKCWTPQNRHAQKYIITYRERKLLYSIALFCNASVRPVRPFLLNFRTPQNGFKFCSIHRASVLINHAEQLVVAKSSTAGTGLCRFITNVGLLRFGSFWAQNVCNIALIIYKYILLWCTAWYGRYGHREPKNETPPIWLILSPK